MKHGHSVGYKTTPTYNSWAGMWQRCTDPNYYNFAGYGGRGIKVSERWKTFEGFLADMGIAPRGKSIDRYPDNSGNYEPGNCRWASPTEQANNRRPRRLTAIRVPITCYWCGIQFLLTLGALKKRTLKREFGSELFCSTSCSAKWRSSRSKTA